MRIIHRLPISQEPRTISVRGDGVLIRPQQIIVWVSIHLADVLEWDPRTPRLPAILDTGNNHNFSIREEHLVRWAGIRPEAMAVLGALRERGKALPLHAGSLWLHANRPGKPEPAEERRPLRLAIDEGIAVYPEDGSGYPRLPLLGLRSLLDSRLQITIDGKRREVGRRTAGWL
jgi:hypothetical protein